MSLGQPAKLLRVHCSEGDRYKGKPLSDPVLRIALVALALILDRAVRVHKVLAVNPARGVVRLRRPADTERDRVEPFTPEELRVILRAAVTSDADFATFLRFWVQTGARLGEVLGVQNHDLDMAKGKVHIRRTYSPGRSDLANYRPGPTKTRTSRVVSFTHPITEMISVTTSDRSAVRDVRTVLGSSSRRSTVKARRMS